MRKVLNTAVIISALGYFVDIYDLLLFSIVRIQSLKSIGIAEDKLLEWGVVLINSQMSGLLIGGVLWGILGDKRGRISVLFGSIFLYSVANILNAFVYDVYSYAILRFIAGIGLAGELGAAITLVSEVVEPKLRGYATSIVAGTGIMGAVFAALIGDFFNWRVAYAIGGGLGLCLLFLRMSMMESSMFKEVSQTGVKRGDIKMLLYPPRRLGRYLCCILIGVPLWFIVGILMTFSPELGKALDVQGVVSAGQSIMWGYFGLSIGDFASGFLSQKLKSRKKVIALFLAGTIMLAAYYLSSRGLSLNRFYLLCWFMGFTSGYWALFVTTAAEHFGTNLRATVTTTIPNWVRGTVVLLTIAFNYLRPVVGIVESAAVVGAVTFVFAIIAMFGLEETYAKDLQFNEE